MIYCMGVIVMSNVFYLNKEKQKIKEWMLELIEDLEDIEKLVIQFWDKETGDHRIICGEDVTSFDLIHHKALLENYSTYKMIKENFITPEDEEDD